MKKLIFFLSIINIAYLNSCDLLDNSSTSGLSDEEIVNGLKTALQVGTDSSVFITSKTDGYFKDAAIKILLPPEAKIIETNIQYVSQLQVLQVLNIDLQSLVNNTVKSMNRAAESASKQAGPIFKNSISALSIIDGLKILNGENPALKSSASFDSVAATHYLVSTTQNDLITVYKQPIDGELDKDLGLGFSTNQSWTTLVTNYNRIADVASQTLTADALIPFLSQSQRDLLKKFIPITQSSLGTYVTTKALDGLFLKVGDQERSIRRDPWKWLTSTVGAILTKVFGSK
jgi:hypothetical protein